MSREIERLKKDKKKANATQNYTEMASICNALGELLAQQGEYEEAIEEHKTELTLCEIKHDRIGVSIANRKIGECYCSLQNFDEAFKFEKQHLEIAQQEDNMIEKQRAHTTIGRTYLIQSETIHDQNLKDSCLKKAETAFKKSLDLCTSLRSSMVEKDFFQMKARSLINMGLVYDSRGIVKQCAEYIQRAIHISKKYTFWDDIYRCQCILAGIYQRHGENVKALRHWEEAYQASHKGADKDSQVEALGSKSMVFIDIEDFQAAARCCRKAYKLLKNQSEEDKECIKSLLIATDKLFREAEKRAKVHTDEEKMKIYEKMGDLTANAGLYKTGIKYYQKMLKSGIKCGKEERDLIPAYISLAQTYCDNHQYELAIEYYQKELDCRRTEPAQACRTWLNIAGAQESMNANLQTVTDSYMKAYMLAEEAERPTLKVKALESLALAQKKYGEEETGADTMRRVEELKEKYDVSDSEEDVDSQEIASDDEGDEYVDFDLLLESDDSGGEEFDRSQESVNTNTAGRARRSRPKTFKVNDKGETPLHRACIEGNLKRVKVLIDQGHQLNVRDYSGWIPLHEASNHGYLEIVEYLLDKGAEINDRGGDECDGITPLHDAAANGKIDVVHLLVTRGANVHAKDDNGDTPLNSLKNHRRRCGELTRQEQGEYNDVVKLLRSKMTGNNPHMPSSNNLPRRQHNSDSSSEDEDIKSSKRSRRRMASYDSDDVPGDIGEDSLIREYENRSPTPPRLSARVKRKSSSPVKPTIPQDTGETNSEDVYLNPDLENLETINPQDAAHVYQSTISSFRTRTSTQLRQKTSRVELSKSETSALVDENEYVGDDWLVNDMRPTNKRKRFDVDHVFSTRGVREHTSHGDDDEHITSQSHRPDAKDDRVRKRKRNNSDKGTNSIGSHLHHDLHLAVNNLDDDVENIDAVHLVDDFEGDRRVEVVNEEITPRSQDVRITLQTQSQRTTNARTPLRQVSGHNEMTTINSEPVVPTPQPGAIMRLKVKVNNKCLVVPIDMNSPGEKTIDWLAKAASERFYKSYGLRPILKLSTKDGALLCPDDYIVHLLTHNEEVLSEIDNFDLPALPIRYEQACKTAKQVAYKNIKGLLQTCVGSYTLNMSNLALRPAQFASVTKALQCQSTLKQLHLKGNRLGDDGFEHLIKVLHTLPNLCVLDVSSNGITHTGLSALVKILFSTDHQEQPLKMLERLDMSYNLLLDGCTSTLAAAVSKLPHLSHLGLSSCDITKTFFQQHRMTLQDAFLVSNVHSIDISYNNLSSTGVELLLKSLKALSVTDLDLTATVQSYHINHLIKHIINYTQQKDCVLQSIVIDKCCLTQEHSEDIAKLVECSESLQKLSVAGNSKLSQNDFTLLLGTAAKTESSQLHSLTFTNCGMSAPINIDFLDAVNDKLNHTHPLRYLDFTCVGASKVDMDSLADIWKTRWIDGARCVMNGSRLTFSVADLDD